MKLFSWLKKPEVPSTPDPVPASPVVPDPASPEVLYFKVIMEPGAEPVFKKYGEPNPDFSLSKTDLIGSGYIDERVFKYYEIEGVPEIMDGVVSFSGVKLGHVKRNDKKKIEDLLASGCSYTVGIYGGEYKRIVSDWDYEKDREVYELDRGESPVAATLRIKK